MKKFEIPHSLRAIVVLAFLIIAFGLSLPAQTQSAQTQNDGASASLPTYVIGPSDVLEIYVWKDPSLSRKVLVRPDGRISFPLIQDLPVANLTPGEVKQEIEKRLKEYIEVPNVTVIVDQILSYKVYVNGRVGKSGLITSDKPITVLQALALAGGLQDFAKVGDITIVRDGGTDSPTLFKFNYVEVVQGKNSKQNMLLKSGDVVIVP